MTTYDLETMQYHISLLIECVDKDTFPLNKFILDNKLNKQQVDSIFSMIEGFDGDITKLINEIKEQTDLNSHQLEPLIISFYKENRYEKACYQYAKSFGSTASEALIKIVHQYKTDNNI